MGKTKFTCILQEFGSALAGLINGCESLQRLINRNDVVCYLCIFPQIKLLFLILDVKIVIACVAKQRPNPLSEDTDISDFISPVS